MSVLSVLSVLFVLSVVKSSRCNLWFNLRYRDGITGVGAKDNCVSNYGYKLWTKTIYWKRRHYGRSPLHCTLYVSLSWPVGTMCTKYFQRSAGVHTVQPVECTVLKSFLISSSWFFHRLLPPPSIGLNPHFFSAVALPVFDFHELPPQGCEPKDDCIGYVSSYGIRWEILKK